VHQTVAATGAASVTPSAVPSEQTLLKGTISEDQLAGQKDGYIVDPVPYVPTENTKFSLVLACGKRQPADDKFVRAEQASGYGKDDLYYRFQQFVSYYGSTSGSEAVADVKKSTPCPIYVADDVEMKYTGEVPIPAIAGIDTQFAFCAKTTIVPTQHCYVVLARGNFASGISLSGVQVSNQAIRDELTKLAALAGAALLKV
jgi:hypothetical protein